MAIYRKNDEYHGKRRPGTLHFVRRVTEEWTSIPRFQRVPLAFEIALQKKLSPNVPKSPPRLSNAKQLRSISKMRFLHFRKAGKKKKMLVIKRKATT